MTVTLRSVFKLCCDKPIAMSFWSCISSYSYNTPTHLCAVTFS